MSLPMWAIGQADSWGRRQESGSLEYPYKHHHYHLSLFRSATGQADSRGRRQESGSQVPHHGRRQRPLQYWRGESDGLRDLGLRTRSRQTIRHHGAGHGRRHAAHDGQCHRHCGRCVHFIFIMKGLFKQSRWSLHLWGQSNADDVVQWSIVVYYAVVSGTSSVSSLVSVDLLSSACFVPTAATPRSVDLAMMTCVMVYTFET